MSAMGHRNDRESVTAALLRDLRGYLRACIGDAEGQRAVERGCVLTLTAGQVAALAEALDLVEAAVGEDDDGE